MAKLFNFIGKKEENFLKNFPDDNISKIFQYLKYKTEKKMVYIGTKTICILCNRFIVCKNTVSQIIQNDFHLNDHLTVNDYPNHVPVKSYQFSLDKEVLLFNIQTRKNFLTYENMTYDFPKKTLLPVESFFHSNTIRKEREYMFLKHRISRFYVQKYTKKINGKNFLYSWHENKGLRKNWTTQRGEISLGMINKSIDKKKFRGGKNFQDTYRQNIIFFRYFNKKNYDFDLIKRLTCSKLSIFRGEVKYNSIFKDVEKIGFFNFYYFLTTNFFYTNWKFLNADTNSVFRSTFFENLFFFSKKKEDYFYQFITKFFIK